MTKIWNKTQSVHVLDR